MNYENIFNRKNPSLIIFLIDQTATTADFYSDHQWLPDMLADLANDALSEIFNNCIFGESIRNSCFVSVVSYNSFSASVISKGYINDYQTHNVPAHKEIEVCGEKIMINAWKMSVVKPCCEGYGNVEAGFELVAEMLESWQQYTKEQEFSIDHVPVIIHIGTGVMCNHAFESVKTIKGMKFNDGNPILINFIYNPWSMQDTHIEYTLSSNEVDDVLKSIFEMSSAVNPNIAADHETYNLYEKHPCYKFFFVNPRITPQQLISHIFRIN